MVRVQRSSVHAGGRDGRGEQYWEVRLMWTTSPESDTVWLTENEDRSSGGVSAAELGGPEVNGDNGVDRRDCLLPAGALISTLIDSEGIRLTEEEVSMLNEITNRCSKLRRFRSHRFGGRLFVTFELDPETNLNRLELELEPA